MGDETTKVLRNTSARSPFICQAITEVGSNRHRLGSPLGSLSRRMFSSLVPSYFVSTRHAPTVNSRDSPIPRCAGLYLLRLRGTLQSCSVTVPAWPLDRLVNSSGTTAGGLITVCSSRLGCPGIIGTILRSSDLTKVAKDDILQYNSWDGGRWPFRWMAQGTDTAPDRACYRARRDPSLSFGSKQPNPSGRGRQTEYNSILRWRWPPAALLHRMHQA